MYESINEAEDAILSSFFLSLTTNLFESELPNRVGEVTGYIHQVGEWQTQAKNNNGMIGAKAHKHHGYSVSDADPVGVADASHPSKQST